ncbi:hypothetical protein PHET_00301, partial [Paragonimus heterotremus]
MIPVECKRNIYKRFCMGLRNRGLRNKFILKPSKGLWVALIQARGCEALERLDEKRAADESICLAISQNSLNPKPFPSQNRLAVPTGEECWYCLRFDRRAQSYGHNPLICACPRKGESVIASAEALSLVISPEIVVIMEHSSVKDSINKEAVMFLVGTGASCYFVRTQLADKITRHRRAPVKSMVSLAANGTEIRIASSLSARVQLGAFSREHQFLACPNLQWE